LALLPRADRSRADAALLDRVIARDQGALGELYDNYSRLLYGLILRMLRDRAEAEDALQEVFVQIWQRAGTYRPALGTPAGWFVGIARHRAIDRLRARAARGRTVELEPEALAPLADARDRQPAFGEQAAIKAALEMLPAEQRLLIEQAFFLGFTHSELAERFHMPLGTVKTRIRAGIQTLRDHFEAALMKQ
jgi:RNA polymerase sigma-70 factor (ECF subfamily)